MWQSVCVWTCSLLLVGFPAACTHQSTSGAETISASVTMVEDSFSGVSPLSVIADELKSSVKDRPILELTHASLPEIRARLNASIPELPSGVHRVLIPKHLGSEDVVAFMYDGMPKKRGKPAFLFMHGGGFVLFSAAHFTTLLPIVATACECVVVSIDYRLAPEVSFPQPMEDNFAALKWLKDNADELGIDPNRIAVGGESAGAGHAAQLAIAARDRGYPVAFQLLIQPMLDDRTASTQKVPEHLGHYVWSGASNQFAWEAYLGQAPGLETVPYGAVPARVEDLSGLPPTWIGIGSADLFVAESLEFAKRLIEQGVMVELRVFPGGYHGYDTIAEEAALSKEFTQAWHRALHRGLHHENENDPD